MLESLIANASAAGLSKAVKGAACMVGKQALERTTKEALDKALHPALSSSLANLSVIEQSLFALSLSKSETKDLEEFLKSSDFESFVRSIGLLAAAGKAFLPDQEAALRAFLSKVLPGKADGALAGFARAIAEFIDRAAPDAWQTAAGLGVLGQSWSTESIVQSLVADHVCNARNQLEQRIAANSAPLSEVHAFVERYKRATSVATSRLRPQAINESPSVPITELYVEPFVTYVSDKGVKECSRNMLLAASRRSVLLGDPGGGKSTLASRLCYDISSDLLDRNSLDAPELAAQVVLRDYAQEQRLRPCSIIEYLEAQSKNEFQVEAPTGAFKLLLLSDRKSVV